MRIYVPGGRLQNMRFGVNGEGASEKQVCVCVCVIELNCVCNVFIRTKLMQLPTCTWVC
jgi:hypothetical protein